MEQNDASRKRLQPDSSPQDASSGVPHSTIDDMQSAKRLRAEADQISTVLDIHTTGSGNVFEGDILVAYGPAFAKDQPSSPRSQIAHIDMIDSEGQMTITTNITNNLIQTFMPRLKPGTSVRLTNFFIKKRSQFERGDAAYYLHLRSDTIIDSIQRVCKQQKLIPSTTIAELLNSQSNYPISSLGVIVTAYARSGNEYHLQVRDGEKITDKATVYVSDFHKEAYARLEKLLPKTRTPLLLLQNVTRSNAKDPCSFKSTSATFIDELNDECSQLALRDLVTATFKVSGTLKCKNAHLQPYQLCCTICHQPPAPLQPSGVASTHCWKCAAVTTFAQEPFLQCVIDTIDESVDCSMHGKLLQQHIPELAKIPFEHYKKNMSPVVYLMRRFNIHGTFSLALDGNIISVQKATETRL